MTSVSQAYRPQAYRVRRFSVGGVIATVLVLTAIGSAFALRLQDLGSQSLWFDEALSVVFASKPVSELLGLLVTEDIHPPLYPVLLHFWMAFAGDGEFSTRYFSVLPGVALIPLFYVTGKRLALMADVEEPGRPSLVGLVAALLSASSAFYVGYSQETRNYMLVTFLGLLSSYLLLRTLPSSRRLGWAAYAAAMSAAVYTNYTAFLLLVFHAVFVLLLRDREPEAAKRWGISAGAVVLGFLPWLGYTVEQMLRINDYWPGTLRVGTAVNDTFAQLIAGGGFSAIGMAPVLVGLALLFLGTAALALGMRGRGRAPHSMFLLLHLVIPSVILFAVAYTRPKFDPRYLLVATPAFYLILAWGLAALLGVVKGRAPFLIRVLLPSAGVLAIIGIVAVSTVYGEPTKIKADYRGLISFMESRAVPGDSVVFLMSAPHPYIYYSESGMPWYPMERVDDFDGAIIRLNRLAEHHRRLWFVLWQNEWEDPADYVTHVMSDQATEVPLGARFAGLDLRLYELSPNRAFSIYGSPIQHPIEATFGGSLEFWGWNSSHAKIDKSEDARVEVPAGEKLKLDVHWIPQKALQSDLKIILTLVDSDRHVWARTDETMGNPLFAPTKWTEKDIIHDLHDLEIPIGTPPGEYAIELGLYDPRTLKPLDVARASGAGIGAALPLGKIQVKPSAAPRSVRLSKESSFTWQLGADTLEMREAALSHPAAVPGEAIEVTVRWRATETPRRDYSLQLSLMDARSAKLGGQVRPLSAQYPSTKWRSGEDVVAKYWLPLPVELPKGRYWILAEPLAGEQTTAPSVQAAQISHIDVVTPEVNYDTPSMQNTVGALFGGKAELLGFDLSAMSTAPGKSLTLTLFWKSAGPLIRSYKVFNHVVDDANVFAGQKDAVPVGDSRPTATWRTGEVLVDRYEIPISADAKPGSYHLKVGMYSVDGGERLSASGRGGASLGDSITLADIEVAP